MRSLLTLTTLVASAVVATADDTKPFVGELRYEVTSTEDSGEVFRTRYLVLVKPPLIRMEQVERDHVDITQLDLDKKTSTLARKGRWSLPPGPIGREAPQDIVRRWHKQYSCARDGHRLTLTSKTGEVDFECEFSPKLGSSHIAWALFLVSHHDLKCDTAGVPKFVRQRRDTCTNEWRLIKARRRDVNPAEFNLPPVGTEREAGEMFFERRSPETTTN